MLRVFKHFGGPRISDTEADQDEGSELSGEHEDSDHQKVRLEEDTIHLLAPSNLQRGMFKLKGIANGRSESRQPSGPAQELIGILLKFLLLIVRIIFREF